MTRRPDPLPRATRAGILCQDTGFQRFAALRCGLDAPRLSPPATAEWLRRQCRVASRRDLDTTPAARAAFDALVTDFDEWRGKIAARR